MRRAISLFLPLIILLTTVCSMPTRDTGDQKQDHDRDSDEDGSLIDHALLRIFEAEDELATVVKEIQEFRHDRDHFSSHDAPADQDQSKVLGHGDQPFENQPQPFEDLPQGDMPIEGPLDDNEAQEIGASPTGTGIPLILGERVNDSVTAERYSQELPSDEGRKRDMQKEMIRTRVWNYTRPGNHSEDPSRTQGKKTDSQNIHDFMRELRIRNDNSNENMRESQPRTSGHQSLQDLLRTLHQNNGFSTFFTKSQSLFPSCEIPKNTDEEVWLPGENSFSLNLLFNFSQTKLAATGWDVLEATLRLYKMAQLTPLVTSCNLPIDNDSRNGSNVPADISTTSDTLQATTQGQSTTGGAGDRLVRVTVYVYTRALKKNRVKRRRLESRTMSLDSNEWTAWNVLTAAKVYLETRRNFGLLVEVEDENHCLLPAHRIFKGINCSEEAATARPVPFPIINAYEDRGSYSIGGRYTLNENSYPIMDIRSFESHPVINGATSDIFSTVPSDSELTDQAVEAHQNSQPQLPPTVASLVGHRLRHGDTTNSGNHRRRRRPTNVDDVRNLTVGRRVIMTAEEQQRLFSSTTPQSVTR